MNFTGIKYLLPFLIYWSIYRAFNHTGWIVFFPILFAFAILPLLELLIKPNAQNMSAAEEDLAKKNPLYDLFLYAIVPMQYLTLYWFLTSMQQPNLLWWEKMGRILAMGLACGTFGINVGHELGHRNAIFEQWMAKSLLLTSLYTHFFIEHNKGHHKHVSTPSDPSSAPYRMSLYVFWVRSVFGTYRGAWSIANDELRKKGLPIFHWQNEMLQLQLLQVCFLLVIGTLLGWQSVLWFSLAAIMGFLLLETVNYIEHYGLQRHETTKGKFERAQPQHSWNSNHLLGRLMLFELSRHSDHHYLASRKYQILRHHDSAPQLPTGYPGSMLLATIPPFWFAVMDRQMKKFKVGRFESIAA